MKNVMRSVVCVSVACGATGVAGAAITSVAGQGAQISPPVLADWPVLTGPLADAWDEQTNVTAPSGGVQVDMLVGGGFMTSGAPTGGVLTAIYDSHFVHFTAGPLGFQALGSVTFNAPIEAVIFSDLFLDLSDGIFGAGGTTYPTGQIGRGINPGSFLIANGNVLQFDFVGIPGAIEIEQVRVLTRVPTPGAVALGALGVLTALRRKR
ncbi:MAG: hypothetical protein AB7G17_12205 [Phycisphaerales bacterium]